MKWKVSCEKLHISQAERTMSLEILNKMAYAQDEGEYTKLLDQLKPAVCTQIKSCFSDLHAYESISCDSCLEWYHWKCVGLSKPPKAKYWFCCFCYANCGERHKSGNSINS